MADPIKADCHTDYHATRTSGTRDPSVIFWVVMHDTEGGTAKSIAEYFATPAPGGSAHLAVDDNHCYRCLPNEAIAWGAPGANTHGFHIEQCGYAAWTAREWRDHIHTLERAAFKAAFHCHKFGLPAVFVDAAGLKARHKGITTHAECSKAFGGDHSDPGPGWPRAMFMALAQRYWRELEGGPQV